MRPALSLGFFGLSAFAEGLTTGIAYPLTYDEADSLALTWTRQGSGPHVTPAGFSGDGFEARYRATASLPSFITAGTAGPLCLHASVNLTDCSPRSATRDVIVSVCENDATAKPKLSLCVVPDTQDATLPNLAMRVFTDVERTRYLARKNWAYGFQFPALTAGGQTVRPQGLLFLDSDTILVSGHYNGTLSRVYKVRVSDNTVLGFFDFPSPYNHVGAIADRASDGTYWFGDYASEKLLRVDLDASFATGAADIDLVYDMAAIGGFAAIEWTTISGTEYLLAAEYVTSGTAYLYVIDPADVVNAGTFVVADRIKRFVAPLRMQGCVYYTGKLYVSTNQLAGDATATGKVQRFDLATAIISGSDGDTLTAEQTWFGPSQYVEDIDFQPTTGHLWMQTEGRASVADADGFLSAWYSDLTLDAMTNHVTLWYAGSSADVEIRINDRAFGTANFAGGNLSATPAAVVVGGPPQAVAGQTNGFFIGYVRDIVIQDTRLTSQGYAYAVGGDYEPNTLTAYTFTITNPGAESTTTGWTNETGSLANRASNPLPHSGASYFYGGSNVTTLARQRFSVATVTGLSTGAIDTLIAAGNIWTRADWWQASFDGAQDPCSMGIRNLNSTPTQINRVDAGSVALTPALTWFKRGLPVTMPTNTRNVDLLMAMNRTSGTNNDSYIDDITATIYVR